MYGTYKNKHNGREITIEKMEISDSGTYFWYADAYDMFTERDLERNWVMVSELGTPKPAMTDMEHLRLQLEATLAQEKKTLLSQHDDGMETDDVVKGWIEALEYVLGRMDAVRGGE